MSKTLKRLLLILIVLIVALLLIPKSEKAFTLTNSTFSDGRYWCIQMDQDYKFGTNYSLYRTYNLYGDYYTIDNGETKYTNDMDILNAIAYITEQGDKTRSEGSTDIYGNYVPGYSPYFYSSQYALWYYLSNINFTDGLGYTAFESYANSKMWIKNGELFATRPSTGQTYGDGGKGLNIYNNARSNNKKYNGTIQIYKCGDGAWQRLMFINIGEEPQEPEKPEGPEATRFNGSINGMAWVDGQMRR